MTKDDFRSGVRVLMLIQRTKEGGSNRPDYHAHKRISRNEEEFEIMKKELLEIKSRDEAIPYRLYSSVNARDLSKAIRLFKQEMLDADYYDQESKERFYIDIKNRWFGCLMKHQSRSEKAFLIDVDKNEGDDLDVTLKMFDGIRNNILLVYPTPNGWHIITKPYNPELTKGLKIKKDALMLLEA